MAGIDHQPSDLPIAIIEQKRFDRADMAVCSVDGVSAEGRSGDEHEQLRVTSA
jgi:hypothetical protein